MRRALALLSLAAACSAPAPISLGATVTCAAEGHPRRQACTVRLTDRASGRPLTGVTVTLHAEMPGHTHSVPPGSAVPGPEPGTYRAPYSSSRCAGAG